ncbi:MAG: ComEA family DNA-binding protein [Chloroflexi bacterium]|nr:ComEA family DNA-binding protein [Chloroflexota bacterium]
MPSSPLPHGGPDTRVSDIPNWWRITSVVLAGLGICAVVAGAGYWAGRRTRPAAIEIRVSTPTIAAPMAAYIGGAVTSPGVYTLPPGARVNDLVEAAGGFLLEADASAVNLAAKLSDGQRVIVPTPRRAETGATGRSLDLDGGSDRNARPLNLNTANLADLASLPRIGPVTAAAIVEWRELNGGFRSVDDLLNVRGIGQITLDAVRSLVTVE